MILTPVQLAIVTGAANGILCVFITLGIEKLGGILGSILGCVPSTLMIMVWAHWSRQGMAHPSTEFPYLTQTGFIEYQKTLLTITPVMLVNSFYLYLWQIIPKLYFTRFPNLSLPKLLTLVFLTIIGLWFACTVPLVVILKLFVKDVKFNATSKDLSGSVLTLFSENLTLVYCLGLGSMVIAIIVGFIVCWYPPAAPKGKTNTPWYIFILRGLGTATTSCLSVYLAKYNAYVGGVLSVFPVIFTTAMVSVWLQQGRAVSQGAIGPLMLGHTSTGVLIVCMAFLPSRFNFYGSLAICFLLCALLVNGPAYLYLQWRRKVVIQRQSHLFYPKEEEEH